VNEALLAALGVVSTLSGVLAWVIRAQRQELRSKNRELRRMSAVALEATTSKGDISPSTLERLAADTVVPPDDEED
jgi:hypothetical protein